jgi:pimeloyl-ACP methyl ester carboxylesterase
MVGLACLMLVAGCAGQSPAPAPAAAPARAGAPASPPVPERDAAGTVWLCRPGLAHDPCAGDLETATAEATGVPVIREEPPPGPQQVNCFYVYPTASTEQGLNSNLQVQPAETEVASDQAAQFSRVCNVWAPMYRQVTVNGLGATGAAAQRAGGIAFASVVAAWRDFITNYDDGHPIIFIGHSQGSLMIMRLLARYVDDNPAMRRLLVLAVIAGGNVTVPTGRLVGGTFRHIPLCSATRRDGCVIAYSSFPSTPPSNSLFGRPGQGISLSAGQTATTGVQVACVNPAAIGGGTASLSPIFAVSPPFPMTPMSPPGVPVSTPFVAFPGLYRATCRSADGATWLEVTHSVSADDHRPLVTEPLGAIWGYHLEDINLALGNLVADARAAEQAYATR